jgi:hypothetical protein
MRTKWGSVGNGWDHLVQPLIDHCEKNNIPIAQIKEKFGGLRFYLDTALNTDPIWGMIDEAEQRSLSTCEECGEPGTRKRIGGWLKTVCDDQFAEWVKKVRAGDVDSSE